METHFSNHGQFGLQRCDLLTEAQISSTVRCLATTQFRHSHHLFAPIRHSGCGHRRTLTIFLELNLPISDTNRGVLVLSKRDKPIICGLSSKISRLGSYRGIAYSSFTSYRSPTCRNKVVLQRHHQRTFASVADRAETCDDNDPLVRRKRPVW